MADSFPDRPLEFEVRKDRRPSRIRRFAWLAFTLFALMGWATLFKWLGAAGASLAVLAGGLAWAWGLRRYIGKRFPAGVASLRIDARGLQSPLLSGAPGGLAWQDIAAVEVGRVGTALTMSFRLRGDGGAPGEQPVRRFGKAAGPRLVLDMFDPAQHETIVDAVHARLAAHLPPGDGKAVNPVTAERVFKAQLKALTPRTWVTWSLAAVNVLVFLMLAASTGEVMRLPVASLLEWGGNSAWETQHGGWWRLAAAMFLHGGLMHLAFNMLALLTLGPLAERLFGPRAYLLLYLLAGLAGSALSLNFNAQQAVSVGASGAIFGVAGALMTAVWRHRATLPALFGAQAKSGLTFYVIYSLAQGFSHQGTDNAAHVGGLVAGCLMACLLPIRWQASVTGRRRVHPVLAGLAGVALVGVMVMGAPASALDQRAILRGDAALGPVLTRLADTMTAMGTDLHGADADKARAWAADERGRIYYAPRFAAITQELDAITLHPKDPRRPMVDNMRALSDVLHESLAMASVPNPVTGKPEPVDPIRFAVLETELARLLERTNALAKEFKARKPQKS